MRGIFSQLRSNEQSGQSTTKNSQSWISYDRDLFFYEDFSNSPTSNYSLEFADNPLLKQLDPHAFFLGTAAATVGRLATFPFEGTSFSMQLGQAKTLGEAIKQNFKGTASFKGGVPLVKSAVIGSSAYYGAGFAIMSQHKDEPILIQAAWGGLTAVPEQLTVTKATETVRERNGLSNRAITAAQWWKINLAYFGRHAIGNPSTFAAIKTCEKLLEEVVPEKYHPFSSFLAGLAGVYITHRTVYSFPVAWSVQLMISPELSMKEAWKKAAKENYIKAGDIRAVGRMGTAAIAFCIMKIYEINFAGDKLKSEKTKLADVGLFSNADMKTALLPDSKENHTPSLKN